jgi:hypothetical protein
MIAISGNHYRLFGGVLNTSIELPELHPATSRDAVTWTLVVHDGVEVPKGSFALTADEDLAGGISVRLERDPGGTSRLTYSDTGTFDISADGARIDWYRADGASAENARTDILGRVISIATQSTGVLMLHASAVSLNGEVAGFLAPKFYGKSTLACALTDAGAHLVTDDALAVRADDRVSCAPGVPAIRLRSGAASFLRGTGSEESDENGWRHFERRAPGEVLDDWAPLGALYVLQPRHPEEMSGAATRERLSGSEAALSLVRFAKLGSLLRGRLAVEYLDRAATIASRTHIYTLNYARDLKQLGKVAAALAEWHRG